MNKRRIHQPERSSPAETKAEAALLNGRRSFHRFLVRRLGSVDAADDVFQEFSLRVLAKAASVKNDESVISWLYRVLQSTLVDYSRKTQRQKVLEAAFAADPSVSPERAQPHPADLEAELHAAICECLYEILPALKAEHRDVLWRLDLLGEPRRAVAKELGISTGAVTVRLHRARASLRDELIRICRACPEHGFEPCGCDRAQIAAEVKQSRRRTGKGQDDTSKQPKES